MIEVNKSRYTCKTYIKVTVIITIIFFCLGSEKSIETIVRICTALVCYTRINFKCPIYTKQKRKEKQIIIESVLWFAII